MEDQLWKALYRLVVEEGNRRGGRGKRLQFSDGLILLVAFWAILHDRPICWACREGNWRKGRMGLLSLPSPATMSRRLRTLSVQLLLEQVFYRLLSVSAPGSCLCRRLDSKPLVVGGFSKDRDARRGYATGGMAKGYKIFGCWRNWCPSLVPEAMVLGPLSESDQAGAVHLIDRLDQLYHGTAGGYLLADSLHDTNPLHGYAGAHGFQLLTPRKEPGTGLGKCRHSPYRLRSIHLLEGPEPTFGRTLYRLRGSIERDFGHLGNFGGGLQPLPNFVRRPRRVALWVLAKLVINGLRICAKTGLTP